MLTQEGIQHARNLTILSLRRREYSTPETLQSLAYAGGHEGCAESSRRHKPQTLNPKSCIAGIAAQRGIKGVQTRGVRSDYYDLTLDERMLIIDAPSTAHLCKSSEFRV